ncbi:MAG: alpha/beta hydrolase fold domain-containing protein [Streptosporangiales bacterium]|nr:alpha/beta hydrolase fold domain-containing protein [Streptosporangiales bacterium]
MSEDGARDGLREQLLHFMETFEPPSGDSPLDVLKRCDPLMNEVGPDVERIEGVPLRTVDSWRVTADVFVPRGTPPFPTLVYFHGGGWVTGNPATHRRLAEEFADGGFLTISVDYRRAPKHRFPAALDDCAFAVGWAAEHAGSYGGGSALAVGGDSAGANLAAAVLANRRGLSLPPVAAGLLLYGIYEFHDALPVLGNLVGGSDAGSQLYLPADRFEELRGDPRVSPLYGCRELPPCYLTVGSRDPLLDQTLRLAEGLRGAGVEHDLHVADGAPHAFLQLAFLEAYAEGHRRAREFLTKHVLVQSARG